MMNVNKSGKKQMSIIILITLVILGAGLFWLVFLSEESIIRESYNTNIIDAPNLCGKTYSLDKNNLLLVVENLSTGRTDGFMIKLKERIMGIPNFGGYRSFGKWAIVDAMIHDGFPYMGELIAEFSEQDGEITIFVKGMADDPNCNDFDTVPFLKKNVPIYKKKIILTKM